MDVPAYDDLPIDSVTGFRCAWGVFGPGDEIGTLNHLGPEQRRRAAALVREGRAVNLSLPLTLPSPPLFGRKPYAHHILSEGYGADDYLDGFYLQGSSQWDGLRHIKSRGRLWGGRSAEEAATPEGPLGSQRYAEHGMFGRGVLIDAAAHLARQGTRLSYNEGFNITVELLEATLAAQGTALEEGDLLLLRTGWVASYRAASEQARAAYAVTPEGSPGLSGSEAMARWLWNHRVAAVAGDNPALEWNPGDPADGFLHRRVLPMLGMIIGEMLDFDELGAACASAGRYDVCFVAVPLNLPGGVGSPANALAIL